MRRVALIGPAAGRLYLALRDIPVSAAPVVLLVPASLLALFLWNGSPSLGSPHDLHRLGAGTAARPLAFAAAWLLMSAAMMLPSALPLVVSTERLGRLSDRKGAGAMVAAGYLAVWGLVGAAAFAANAAAVHGLAAAAGGWLRPSLLGIGLVAAGFYGLSPLAAACLRACRRPFGFLARYWQGPNHAYAQSARIGIAYGLSCVGCCVPMIAAMFAVGMADLAVVIALGAGMILMKSRSEAGPVLARLLAVTVIAAGVITAVGGLTPPESHGHH